MIIFPKIDPVIFSFGIFSVNFYSLSYVTGIILGWYVINKIISNYKLPISAQNLSDMSVWFILGMLLGGRLAYVFLYNPEKYLNSPIDILKTYEGGMSFHGAVIGITMSVYFFAKKHNKNFFTLMDLVASVAPIGIMFGRIANFFNAELYGRYTDMPWGVLFPNDLLSRHPSQLYEAFFEGLVLACIMYYCVKKLHLIKYPKFLSGVFLLFYSIFRIFIEFFREPDIQIGFIFEYLTFGQLLCIPMTILGIYLIKSAKNTKSNIIVN